MDLVQFLINKHCISTSYEIVITLVTYKTLSKGKQWILYTSQVAHQASVYSGFSRLA